MSQESVICQNQLVTRSVTDSALPLMDRRTLCC